jgi:hypothetical protein
MQAVIQISLSSDLILCSHLFGLVRLIKLRSFLEFLHTLTYALEEFGNFTAAKQENQHKKDQNYLGNTNFSHCFKY